MSQLDKSGRYRKHSLPWFNKASDLHASAGVLWLSLSSAESKRIVSQLNLGDGFDMAIAVPPVFRMLCGLSLELTYKAILVGHSLDIPHHHKLLELAKLAGVSYAPREVGLLKILTESIEWAGRYPIPRKPEKMDELSELVEQHLFEIVSEGNLKLSRSNNALSWSGYEGLWSKAQQEFWHRWGGR